MSRDADPRDLNFYSGARLDRADDKRMDQAWLKARLSDPATRFVPVWRARNLIGPAPDRRPSPAWLTHREARAIVAQAGETAFLGLREDRAYIALDLSALEPEAAASAVAPHGGFRDLREVGPLLSRPDGAVLAYARGLMHWHRTHRFCGACGAPTDSVQGGHARRCRREGCGRLHFPRTDPAVIVLIHDGGDRCVLGRQQVWPPGMHSTLAGFVEPGESLEEAVAREVMEEVGIALAGIAYHSSQPWPFPSSLMLGFHARALDLELQPNTDELESAAWFDRATLLRSPEDERFRLPRGDSIARRLIEDWLAGRGSGPVPIKRPTL